MRSKKSGSVESSGKTGRARKDSGAYTYASVTPTPPAVRFDEQQLTRDETDSPRRQRMEADFAAGPPTPVDDTPYIRFAIDQLTRNEELRGSQSTDASIPTLKTENTSVYTVERMVPDDGLGYVSGAGFTSTAEKEREALALVRKHRSLPARERRGLLFAFNPTRPLSALEGEEEEGGRTGDLDLPAPMRRKLLSDCEACVPAEEAETTSWRGAISRPMVVGAATCVGVVIVVAAVVFCAVYFTRRRTT